MFMKHLLLLYPLLHPHITWASTNKTKLKKLFGEQKQAADIKFNQDRFMHVHPLLKTPNALNACQINSLQYLCSCTRQKQTHPLKSSNISFKQ